MTNLDQIVAKTVQMQKVTELGLLGMTLIEALPITGEARPEWMRKYGKVAWFRFDDMIKLSDNLKSLDGQIIKKHYLVQILDKFLCLDCGKAWKGQPRKPCTN